MADLTAKVAEKLGHKEVIHISQENKKLLRFFNGEFNYIYEECKNDKTYLGWSSNIKGVIVPLFILYLDRNKVFSNVGENKAEFEV